MLDYLKKKAGSLGHLAYDLGFFLSRGEKAFYVGWQGNRNLGDEVLFEAVRGLFSNFVFYERPYHRRLQETFRYRYDGVFLGGGTLINRSDEYLNQLTGVRGRNKIVFGSGVANPDFWRLFPGSYSGTRRWVEALNAMDYLSVRGPVSKALLLQWGVTREVVLTGDPALLFAREEIRPKRGSKVLGVNVGATRDQLWGKSDGAFLESMARELELFGEEGWQFVFFPVYPGDIPATETVMKKVAKHPSRMVENYLDREKYMEELEKVDIFVGEKLHSVVLALCANTPGVMLEYRPKCRDFMESLGLEKYVVRTDAVRRGSVFDLAVELYGRIEEEQRVIRDRTTALKKVLVSEAARVKGMLRP